MTTGDRVLYRIGGTHTAPELRPADVVAGEHHTLDLAIFTRGTPDLAFDRIGAPGQPLLPEAGDGIGEWRPR